MASSSPSARTRSTVITSAGGRGNWAGLASARACHSFRYGVLGDLLEATQRAPTRLVPLDLLADLFRLDRLRQQPLAILLDHRNARLLGQLLGEVQQPACKYRMIRSSSLPVPIGRFSPVRNTGGNRRHRENFGRLATIGLLPWCFVRGPLVGCSVSTERLRRLMQGAHRCPTGYPARTRGESLTDPDPAPGSPGIGRCSTISADPDVHVRIDLAEVSVTEEWSRAHWGAINGLHYVRDEAFGEGPLHGLDRPRVQNLAALRNAALNLLRRAQVTNILAKLRSFTRNPGHSSAASAIRTRRKPCAKVLNRPRVSDVGRTDRREFLRGRSGTVELRI